MRRRHKPAATDRVVSWQITAPNLPILSFQFTQPVAEPRASCVGLVLHAAYSAVTSPWGVRAWRWHIVADGIRVGTISLRDGHSHIFTHLLGHIGFAIDDAYRGHGYAGLAVRVLLPEIARLGLDQVWITTTPENAACRRTLERLGCTFVEQVEVPPTYPTYARGERRKLRYRLAVNGEGGAA